MLTKPLQKLTLLSFFVLLFLPSPCFPSPTTSLNLEDVSGLFPSLSFEDAYSVLWGQPDVAHDGSQIQLRLDKHSGSGFSSQDNYLYGFYSASIKLPKDYTAGIVLAFYTSNGGEFPDNHDELDFEFLGNVKGKPWRMQTNIYGNGSVSRGREERFNFWFDPTADFHDYSILWNDKRIVFMVDNIPIREMEKTEALGGDYPSKPMALYATMWDGSQWATDGGKYPVDYKYAPFLATFTNLKLEGCAANPIVEENQSNQCTELENLKSVQAAVELLSQSDKHRTALKWVRSHHLYYSYCDDKNRYAVPLPECNSQQESSRVVSKRRSHSKKSSSVKSSARGRNLIEQTQHRDMEGASSRPISMRVPHSLKLQTRQSNTVIA